MPHFLDFKASSRDTPESSIIATNTPRNHAIILGPPSGPTATGAAAVFVLVAFVPAQVAGVVVALLRGRRFGVSVGLGFGLFLRQRIGERGVGGARQPPS